MGILKNLYQLSFIDTCLSLSHEINKKIVSASFSVSPNSLYVSSKLIWSLFASAIGFHLHFRIGLTSSIFYVFVLNFEVATRSSIKEGAKKERKRCSKISSRRLFLCPWLPLLSAKSVTVLWDDMAHIGVEKIEFWKLSAIPPTMSFTPSATHVSASEVRSY